MKITQIEEFVTAVPHIPSIEKSRPGDYRERPISIIKVHTDEGICGVGESGRGGLLAPLAAEWASRGSHSGSRFFPGGVDKKTNVPQLSPPARALAGSRPPLDLA